jgi:glycosyltransferase involved in cell wall biosynthesis|uniref:Glycosyltransferase 2-like domain-containing protein n=1 Tax=Attheya septentrionalis TaxID=420275 RepID=A0A7S2UKS9_9STRA|mmetsp:Transcript_2651/g.4812  ORF Transcript_2651/g.4812 Transcript_2651/m.4812 type:complete len:291 (+) Transcript_2651:109-981(+)
MRRRREASWGDGSEDPQCDGGKKSKKRHCWLRGRVVVTAGALVLLLVAAGKHEHRLQMSHPPMVTFIIPSMLRRSTLNRTLQSLLNQTVPYWEAVVGVDAITTKSNETIALARNFIQDPSRVHYQNIHTATKFRGRKRNGSGSVRNAMIKNHAIAEWIAFVDDDDTISPYYVEQLTQHIEAVKNDVDIVLFRMQGFPGPKDLVPPLNHTSHHLKVGDIGISFAVRRKLFQDGIEFVPHPSEDYSAYDRGAVVRISTCILYFIRQYPSSNDIARPPHCILEPNDGNPITIK